MTVKVRPYKSGGWVVDIVFQLDSGQTIRKRLKSPVQSKSGSLSWGQGREHLIKHGLEPTPTKRRPTRRALAAPTAEPNPEAPTGKEVPTLAELAPRYIQGYARANRQKPTSIDFARRRMTIERSEYKGSSRCRSTIR